MVRDQRYYNQVRQATQQLWNAINTLKDAQVQWNALDYGNTLPDGESPNNGLTKTEVGAVVFDTANAISTLLSQGHATNLAKLL